MPKQSEILKKKNIANIVKKVQAGKVISEREQKLFEEFEAEEIKETTSSDNVLLVKIKTIASIFGVSERQVYRWKNIGLPEENKNLFDVKKCFNWWCENIGTNDTKDEKSSRERYWKAKAENEEIKVEIKKGLLIASDKIFTEFAERASDLKTSLRALKYRISGLVVGKNQDEIMQILGAEIDEMLRNFCRNGRYIALEENKTDKKEPAKTKKTAKNQIKKAVKDKKITKTANKAKKEDKKNIDTKSKKTAKKGKK